MKKLYYIVFLLLFSCSPQKLEVGTCIQLKKSFFETLFNNAKGNAKYFVLSLEQKCQPQVFEIIKKEGNKYTFKKNSCILDAILFEPSDIADIVSCK